MPILAVNLLAKDQKGEFIESLKGKEVIHLEGETPLRLVFLDGGMGSGKPSAAFIFPLPDGRVVVAETSGALVVNAGRMCAARFPHVED